MFTRKHFDSFPTVVDTMRKTVLHWSYHNLKSIPTSLLEYKELEEVYLKENFIVSIPQWLLELVNLKFIHLLGNLIREVPENIYYLENLEFLDLSNNRLTSLPSGIGKLVNLKRLNVSGNEIQTLPKEIGKLQKLETLDVSANLINYLPAEIVYLKNLTEILLNDNLYLGSLPNAIFNLPRLESIYADRCGLLYLPAILSPTITHARLFNNRFVSHIPIVYLPHIQRFYDVVNSSYNRSFDSSKLPLIREEETFRVLTLPCDTKTARKEPIRIPCSLYELCLKTIGSHLEKPLDSRVKLPRHLEIIINSGPIAKCSREDCNGLMFTDYYLLIVKRENSSSKLIFSCSFCTLECMQEWMQMNKNEFHAIDWNVL